MKDINIVPIYDKINICLITNSSAVYILKQKMSLSIESQYKFD